MARLHDTAPSAPLHLARAVGGPARFVDVRSSSIADPSRDADGLFSSIESVGPTYQRIVLGFVVSGRERSRWLTHREISRGVTAAIERNKPSAVVGAVHPWTARP